MSDNPTTRTAHDVAHKIIMMTIDYLALDTDTDDLYQEAAALIEQDRHAVRCEVARQASSLTISPSRSTPAVTPDLPQTTQG